MHLNLEVFRLQSHSGGFPIERPAEYCAMVTVRMTRFRIIIK